MYANPTDLRFFGQGDTAQTVQATPGEYQHALEIIAYNWTKVMRGYHRESAVSASRRWAEPTFADIRTARVALAL